MAVKNWKNYLVKIIVPGLAGKDYLATGYPFRKNCILTARHAIHQHDHDPDREWRFLWRKKGADGKPVEKKIKSPLIVNSDKNLDWAVIQLEFDASLHNTVCFRQDPLPTDFFIQSEGYPAVRHKIEDLPHLGLLGASHSKSDDNPFFQIDVRSGYKKPNDSGGMSGSPIFNRDGDAIVGLFVKVPAGLDGKSIWALSSAALRADPPFNNLLTLEHKSPRYIAIKKLLEKRVFLQGHFQSFLNEAFKLEDGQESLAAAIDAQTMQRCLSSLYRQTCQSLEDNEPVDIPLVLEFCNHLIPEFASDDDKEKVAQYLKDASGSEAVTLSATTHEGIESGMARYDGRKMSMKVVDMIDKDSGRKRKELRAELCFEFPQAAGGLIDSGTGLSETEKSFYFEFCDTTTRLALYQRLTDDKSDKEAIKYLRKTAFQELKYFSEDKKTHYFVRGPGSDDDLLTRLSRECPYFLLLDLNNDLGDRLEEVSKFRDLASLHQLKPENTP